jgi:hypothetical protein
MTMSDYKQIKFKDLPEGVGFWCSNSMLLGDPEIERVIKDGITIWMDGTKGRIIQRNPEETVYIKEADMKDTKKELEAKRQELQAHSNDTINRIAELDKQIADSKVVYSIGDRFKQGEDNKYMLARAVQYGKAVVLVSLRTGLRWNGKVLDVSNDERITAKEMGYFFSGGHLTRCWDYQKQERV